MPALLTVRGRTAPVLLEKHPQSFLGGRKIGFGIEGAQLWIGRNSLVEPFDKRNEGGVTADSVVKGLQGCLLGHLDHSPSQIRRLAG